MELSFGQKFDLPAELQELDIATQSIIANALDYQAQINNCSENAEAKIDYLRSAVGALDKQAETVFFGKEVQIEGNYDYPEITVDEGDFSIKAVGEYGIRRGRSLGFYGVVLRPSGVDEISDPENVQVELSHGIVLADMTFGNRLFNLSGRANINAPISKSTLVTCQIEDFRNKMFAEMFVRQTKRDSRWTDSFDEALYKPEGPDLRALSTRLSRLRSLRGDRVEEYLTYINSKLGVESAVAELICDSLLIYGPGHQEPYVINPKELIVGRNPDICFADAYKIDETSQLAYKLKKSTPTLSLRSLIDGKDGEHILHVPLSSIQYAEFK